MTRAQIVEMATELKLPFIRDTGGAVPIDEWKPKRSEGYDGFRIVGGEIVVDQPGGRFGGAWPLLAHGSTRSATKS